MAESDDRTVTYDIGFKRPPKHTQFQKGISGNPYGRHVERHFVESTFQQGPVPRSRPNPRASEIVVHQFRSHGARRGLESH